MKITPTISVVQMPDIKESLQDRIERLIIGKPITNHLKQVIRCLIDEIERDLKDRRRDPSDEEKTAIEQLKNGLSHCLIVCPDAEPPPPSSFRQIAGIVGTRDSAVEFVFETQEQLLEHEWIKRWSKIEGFCNYAISYYRLTNRTTLMVVSGDGYVWQAIGVINGPIHLDLPVFEPKYR